MTGRPRVGVAIAVPLTLLWVLLPIVWMVITSFSPEQAIAAGQLVPRSPTVKNYEAIFGLVPPGGASTVTLLLPGIRNGIIIGVAVTAANLVFGAPAAYAMTRLGLRGARHAISAFLLCRIIPPLSFIIPLFILFRWLGLVDTLGGVMLAQLAVTLPVTVWFLIGYMRSLPVDFDRAARVDGCSPAQVFFRVVRPLMTPALVGAGVLAFMTSWNDFLFVLILTSSPAAETAQPIIASFSSPTTGPVYGLIMAGATVAAIPPAALALLFQRYLVKGLTSGGLVA